jgi:curli biogenesis system outer membrane secretion channel CsgG
MHHIAQVLTRRTPLGLLLAGAAFAAASVAPLSAQSATSSAGERKATVAVLEFDNAAMVKRDQFAAMTVGVQVMLANALATNSQVQVVERQKIQDILAEQNLASAGRIEPATAAKIGKIIGARYVLLGAFVVDPSMQMRLVVRAVNTETSALEYTEQVEGKGDKIFKLVDQLAGKLNSGLKLPGTRDGSKSKELGGGGPNQFEAMKAMSAARRLEEQGDVKGAVIMYQKSLALNSQVGAVKTRLAMLESKKP